MPKVLIVGLDGATFDVIHPLVAAGRLPNLARIMQTGAWSSLHSTIPPVTPSAWTSFFTGKNPGKHGIYDFQALDPVTYQFKTVHTHQHREKTLWELLGEQGLRSLFIDVPFTYPPKPLNGWMITGYGTPRTPGAIFTYPEDLAERLPAPLRPEVRLALPAHNFDRSQRFLDEWTEIMHGRGRLLRHLITNEAWELFMVVFSITDNMAHVFWTYLDPAHPNYHKPEGATFRAALLDAYVLADRLLGELMDVAGPETTTLVLSDHGFGSVRPRQYLFQRLAQGGYLARRASSSARGRLAQFVAAAYLRFPFLREWVKSLRPHHLKTLRKTLERARLTPTGHPDLAMSTIIASSFGLQLWVNDDGRFPRGRVPADEKATLLAHLAEYLLADRDPVDGLPLIARVHRGADLYHGPFAGRAPDLVIEYANHYRPQTDHPGANPHLEGGHTPDGVLLARGTGIAARGESIPISEQKTAGVPSPNLMDLAPTILHLCGLPIPPDMDGRVLTELFDPAWLATHPIRQGTEPAQHTTAGPGHDLTPEEQASVEEQLRRLGYI